MPQGMCYLWRPGVLSLHLVSDALIALAYFSIPFTLVYFVLRCVRRRGHTTRLVLVGSQPTSAKKGLNGSLYTIVDSRGFGSRL
jgi:hypothetical protein